MKISGFVWTGLFTIVSIYKYDQNHFVFFFSFLSYSEALICIRKPNSRKDSIKGRFYDGVILLYQISSRFCFLAKVKAFGF